MTKEFDLLVFIGRFQPLHHGHLEVMRQALDLSHEVLVLVGSANQGRSLRNPFTYEERRDMIEFSIPDSRLNIHPLNDHTYSDTGWITEVQDIVGLYADTFRERRVGLIGRNKDNTSYYLNLFPQWGSVAAHGPELNATDIRTSYLEQGHLPRDVPDAVHEFLLKFHATDPYKYLQNEANWVANYKDQWSRVPYPVIFQTVDAVVQQSGHILLVRRDKEMFAYRNMLQQFPNGLVAIVADSYDIYAAVEHMFGWNLELMIKNRNGVVIIRPDSGNPIIVLPRLLGILESKFGATRNHLGFKVLPDYLRVIWGDGIDKQSIVDILSELRAHQWAASNIAFGMGGALLQHCNRDTLGFAMKASAIDKGHGWEGISKDPVTDPGKKSKTGVQTTPNLIYEHRDGHLQYYRHTNLEIIRSNAAA